MKTDQDLIILRCACRDWPCHVEYAYTKHAGSCGLCRQKPEIVPEPYQGANRVES